MFKGLATAVIGTIFLLAILGFALGASLGDTELLNPATGAAQAESMEAQTQLERDRAQLELEQRREEIAAQQAAIELELEQRRGEIAAQQAAAGLDLEHRAAVYEQAEKRGELELRRYETTLAQEETFLQRQYELQLQQQRQAFEHDREMKELRQIVLLGVGSGTIIVITAAVAYYLYARGKAQRAQRPTSPMLARSVIPEDSRVMPSYQDQHGGDGRGPQVHSRSQG